MEEYSHSYLLVIRAAEQFRGHEGDGGCFSQLLNIIEGQAGLVESLKSSGIISPQLHSQALERLQEIVVDLPPMQTEEVVSQAITEANAVIEGLSLIEQPLPKEPRNLAKSVTVK